MTDFHTTCWTLVLIAGSGGEDERLAALNKLCLAYWPPAYAYIRRHGKGDEEARDLTQGFFAQLLEKNWLESAAPERGRFRAFLLTMLKAFLANEHDWQTRLKRGGGAVLLPLDWNDVPEVPDKTESPEAAFDRRWALTVIYRAAECLRREAGVAGRMELFMALSPFIAADPEPGTYEAIGAAFRMSKSAVAMAVHRLRMRLRELTRKEVADTLSDRANVDAEMQELMAALRR